jgi:hypothetical protein
MMRGAEVSFDTSDDPGTYALCNTVGWITVELPAGYVSGEPISLLIDGGVFSSGEFPDSYDVTLGVDLVTVDGDGIDAASFSISGDSWAPGSVFSVRPSNSASWNSAGAGAQLTLTVNDDSHCGYTLIDNGSGEGALNLPPVTVFGWSPALRAQDNGTGTPLNPGDRVSFYITAQTFSYDSVNNARGVYPGITGLTLQAGDTVPLDIEDVFVGFSAGSGSWNAYRAIEAAAPTVSVDAEDWYLVEARRVRSTMRLRYAAP